MPNQTYVDQMPSELSADTLRRYYIMDERSLSEPRKYQRLTVPPAGISNGTLRLWPHTSEVVRVPGHLGELDCTAEELNATEVTSPYINGGRPWVSTPRGGACWAKFVDKCESNHLEAWRNEEQKKTVAKLFTVMFVLVGIGILGEMTYRNLCIHLQPAESGCFVAGSVAGSFGSEISALMHRVCLSRVEVVYNAATESLGKTVANTSVFARKTCFFLTK